MRTLTLACTFLTLLAAACGQSKPKAAAAQPAPAQAAPGQPATAFPTASAAAEENGCVTHEFKSHGPQTEAAKALALSKGESLFDTASNRPGPAVATGQSWGQVRARYPAAKPQIKDGPFGANRWVQLVQAGVALFSVNLTEDGETPLNPEELGQLHPENRVMAVASSNPRFRTAAGIRPGMPVAAAQEKAGPAILVQVSGISGADSLGEYLHFGKAPPEDLLFSRHLFIATVPRVNSISWNRNAGSGAPKPCDIHWTRDFRPNATIRTVVIEANWLELQP